MKPLICCMLAIVLFAGCSKSGGSTDPGGNPPPISNPPGPDDIQITSIGLTYGYTGDVFQMIGKNFGKDVNELTAKINGVVATIIPSGFGSGSSCNIRVPAKCGTGPVTITRNGKTATGPSFYYIPSTTVTTLYGAIEKSGFENGTGTNMRFAGPVDFVFDKNNNIYVADHAGSGFGAGNLIRKINGSSGSISTFSGGPLNGNTANINTPWKDGLPAGSGGNSDVNGGSARFHLPYGIGISEGGNGEFKLFVAEASYIRIINEFSATGVYAGNSKDSASTGAHEEGGRDARITVTGPPVIVLNPTDYGSPTIYFLDGNRIVKQSSQGGISTFTDLSTATLKGNLCRLSDGSFIMGSNPLYHISATGILSTFFSNKDSLHNRASGQNEAYQNMVTSSVRSLDVDKNGNIFMISISGSNNTLFEIFPDKSFLRLFKWSGAAPSDGVNGAASLNGPAKMHIRSNGDIYIIDGFAIRKMSFE